MAKQQHPLVFTPEKHSLLHGLRSRSPARRAVPELPITLGQRISDVVASTVGSWRFILIQSVLLFFWIGANVVGYLHHWDPYPFILLNLFLSFQAAYTAPIIMMSQNRYSVLDRKRAQSDYEVNLKAELEIELLHEKIDLMREREVVQLTKLLEEMSTKLDRLEAAKR